MKKLVLIDGVNFYYKGQWAAGKSYNFQGTDVTYVRCFLSNLLNMLKRLGKDGSELTCVVCWDAGYDERLRISSKAVEEGIIPKAYKQDRREARAMQDEEDALAAQRFVEQMKVTQEVLKHTVVGQARIGGEEADDLVGSYAKKYAKDFDEVLLVTTDRDYYQLLEGNVKIYNSGKNEYKDAFFLKNEYNLDSGSQWVDVGALAGESGAGGDTIYGVPGIGYTTAAKLIVKFGSLDNLLNTVENAIALDIKKFGGDALALCNAVKEKTYKLKTYQREAIVVAYKKVVLVARQLKQMRTWLPVSLPETTPDWGALKAWCSDNAIPMREEDLAILTEK